MSTGEFESGPPSGKGSSGLPITIAVITAVAIGLYATSHFSKHLKKSQPQVGQTAPEIVGRDLDGKEFQLSAYRGKVVMLDFWGNW